MLYIAGTIMLFIAMGWKWGLAGLGISWLVILGVNLGITTAYGVRGYVDPLLYERVQEINIVREQHKQELEDFWNVTSPHECASLITSFLDELRRNWAIEYSQLNPERLPDTVKNDFQKSITWAYSIGYMRGKGWISQEHLVDFSINLGDHLAHGVRLAFKGARPNGKAYASGYVAVATRGHLKALQ